MNLEKTPHFIGFALVTLMTLPPRAQNGWVDSPEDPTIALAVTGAIAAVFAAIWVRRSVERRDRELR